MEIRCEIRNNSSFLNIWGHFWDNLDKDPSTYHWVDGRNCFRQHRNAFKYLLPIKTLRKPLYMTSFFNISVIRSIFALCCGPRITWNSKLTLEKLFNTTYSFQRLLLTISTLKQTIISIKVKTLTFFIFIFVSPSVA